MTITVLPSAEAVAIAWASAQPDLAAIHNGNVSVDLDLDEIPAIRVTRIGVPSSQEWIDLADLQFECWAADQETANLLVRTLVAAFPTIRGFQPTTGGTVHTYTVTAGPYWSADDPNISLNARYIVSATLLITA